MQIVEKSRKNERKVATWREEQATKKRKCARWKIAKIALYEHERARERE